MDKQLKINEDRTNAWKEGWDCCERRIMKLLKDFFGASWNDKEIKKLKKRIEK